MFQTQDRRRRGVLLLRACDVRGLHHIAGCGAIGLFRRMRNRAGIARDERAMQSILQKSVQSLKASAFYCYVCGALSAGAAVGAWYALPSPFLIYFTGACAVVLFASGIWYSRASKKQI